MTKITKKDVWDCILVIYKYKYIFIWLIVTLAMASITIPLLETISNGKITSDPAMQLLLILTIAIVNLLCIGILCILWQPHHIELCNGAIKTDTLKD